MLANVAFALFACLVVVLGFGALLVALPAMLAKRSRSAGLGLAYGALIAIGLVAADVVLYSAVRDAGIRRLISRGDQIVAAIGSFERDQGRVPASLEELVPKYLAKIPTTEAAICPEFSYGGDSRSWEIAVGLTQWILDDTRLLYHSDQQYGGCAYRYGPWALSSCG